MCPTCQEEACARIPTIVTVCCEGEDVQERANEAVPISRFEVDENLVEGIDDNQGSFGADGVLKLLD